MAQSPTEAGGKGYADGLCMAEKMRWQGTPIGNLLKGASYRPDPDYRAEYDAGFRQALRDASRTGWMPPEWNERSEDTLKSPNVP